MAHNIMVLLSYLILAGMVSAGGYARGTPGRSTSNYDDIVVVESPIIDLDRPLSQASLPSYPGAAPVGGQDTYPGRYDGPTAVPVVLPDGTLADTPEVAAARRAHLIAVEQARSLVSADDDDGSYDPRKYEHDEHEESAYSGPVGVTRHYNGVENVQAPLNYPYQRPLALQPVGGQYYNPRVASYPVNSPAPTNNVLHGQPIGTQGALGPQYTQVYLPRSNINNHHLESLAARGQLSRQYINSLINQYPENRDYLENLYFTIPSDNHYTESYAFPGIRERPLHDLAKKLVNTVSQNDQIVSKGNALNHDEEKYSDVVAVQSVVGANVDNARTKEYSAPSSGQTIQSSGPQDISHVEYADNVQVHPAINNPVDPNFINQQTLVKPTHESKNHVDAHYSQSATTHFVPASVNGRFVTINNLEAPHHYSGPQAHSTLQDNGFLSDTPEVAAARAAHLAAHQIARERHAQWIARHHQARHQQW